MTFGGAFLQVSGLSFQGQSDMKGMELIDNLFIGQECQVQVPGILWRRVDWRRRFVWEYSFGHSA